METIKMKLLGNLIVLIFSITVVQTSASEPEILVSSQWLINPITLDGGISDKDEWSEAEPVNLQIGLNYGNDPPFHDTRVYAINDDEWLYLLFRIEWSKVNYDPGDDAGINYFWPVWNPITGWDYSDGSYVDAGATYDIYGWDEVQWYTDTEASPPGENNVEGTSSYDGTYYWFELRKKLNSGDGYDWNLKLGRVYGLRDGSDDVGGDILLGLSDEDPGEFYGTHVKLGVSARPSLPVSEGDRIFKATENSVYFVPTGNIYDDSAFYAFYAYKENPQIITSPTQSSASSVYLAEDGSPLFTGDIVTFGGRFANRMVAYFEDAGIAKVGYGWSGTHHLFTRISDGSQIYAVDGSTYDASEKDYFVFQLYNDDDMLIFSEWGISAEGTYAGGTCFIDIIYPNLQDYTDQYYIFSWTDTNNDNMPQPEEITLETSGS